MLQFLTKVSIRTKILGGFIVTSCITILVGVLGYYSSSNTLAVIRDVDANDLQLLLKAEKLKHMALTHRRYEKDFFLNIGKPEKQQGYLDKFSKVSQATRITLSEVIGYVEDDPHLAPEVKSSLAAAKKAYEKYAYGFSDLAKRVMADTTITPQAGNKLMGPIKQEIYDFENGVDTVVAGAEGMMDEVVTSLIESSNRAMYLIAIFVCCCVVLSLLFGIILSKLIAKPIRSAVQFSGDIAEGDFTRQVQPAYDDDMGSLILSLNTMAEKLRGSLREIIDGISDLNSSSTELENTSSGLTREANNTSERSEAVTAATEEMAVNLQAVAAAMEQSATNVTLVATAAEDMSSTISEIAGNADKARAISANAVDQAGTASESMATLGKAANEINQVTETITEISEQTNLLALNATIEAARAGEAGKGFAVVANEIKELAKQTAEATMDIKAKIDEVQQTTDTTIGQIEMVTKVIGEINEIVNLMAEAVGEQEGATQDITANIVQASEGIQEVNENVNQTSMTSQAITREIAEVNKSTDQIEKGSVAVKESARHLSDLAEKLDHTVSRFRI